MTYISDIDDSFPIGLSDPKTGDDDIKQLKTDVVTSFPNISGACTATHTQLNYLAVSTLGTAEASKALTVSAASAVDAGTVTWSDLGAVTTVDVNGGTVDGAVIGGAVPAAGSFTTLTATGAVNLDDGAIDGVAIGGSAPAAGAFTTLTASGDISFTSGTMSGVTISDYLALAGGTMSGAIAMGTAKITGLGDPSAAQDAATQAYVLTKAKVIVSAVIANISAAETVWVPISVAGTVSRVDTVLEGAITVGDASVTLHTSADAEMATITVAQSGSAAGTVDSDTMINNATVAAGTALKLATNGGSTDAQRLWVSIVIDLT